jgi:hypothetical protein
MPARRARIDATYRQTAPKSSEKAASFAIVMLSDPTACASRRCDWCPMPPYSAEGKSLRHNSPADNILQCDFFFSPRVKRALARGLLYSTNEKPSR